MPTSVLAWCSPWRRGRLLVTELVSDIFPLGIKIKLNPVGPTLETFTFPLETCMCLWKLEGHFEAWALLGATLNIDYWLLTNWYRSCVFRVYGVLFFCWCFDLRRWSPIHKNSFFPFNFISERLKKETYLNHLSYTLVILWKVSLEKLAYQIWNCEWIEIFERAFSNTKMV